MISPYARQAEYRKEAHVKRVIGVVAAVIVLCGAVAAYEGNGLEGEEAGALTIAQASKDVYCPYCGAKNEAGAIYCASCGKKLPAKPSANYCPKCGAKVEAGATYCPRCGASLGRRTGGEWKRNIVAISGNVGGILGDPSRAYIGCDVAFYPFDYFALGPEISYFFGDTSGIFTGLEFRPYFVPYSRSTFVKPHAYVGGGYFRETGEVWGTNLPSRPVTPGRAAASTSGSRAISSYPTSTPASSF